MNQEKVLSGEALAFTSVCVWGGAVAHSVARSSSIQKVDGSILSLVLDQHTEPDTVPR